MFDLKKSLGSCHNIEQKGITSYPDQRLLLRSGWVGHPDEINEINLMRYV